MFSKWTRCYYCMCRDIFHPDKSRPRLGAWQMIDIFAAFYLIRLLWLIHAMVTSYSRPYYHPMEPYDLLLHYFHVNAHLFDPYILTVVLFLAIFYLICEYLTFNLNVNHPTWTFWFQLVVENQDNYFACKLTNTETLQRIYRRKERKYTRKLAKNRLSRWIPRKAVKWLCFACGRVEVFLRMEDIHQEELFTRRPVATCPNLSVQLRKIILLTCLAYDALFALGQLVLGKYLLTLG